MNEMVYSSAHMRRLGAAVHYVASDGLPLHFRSWRNMEKRIYRYLFLGLFCLLFVLYPGNVIRVQAAADVYEFFYENPCASCKEEDKIYEIFERKLEQGERKALNYEIRTYNVFQKANMELYEERLKEAGKSREEAGLPLLIAKGSWLSGYDTIESRLKEVLLGEEDSLETSGEEETSGAGMKTSGPQASDPEISAASPLSAWDAFIREIKKENLSEKENAAILFTTYSCTDCSRVKEYLKEQIQDPKCRVLEFNIAEENYVEVLREMMDLYGVEDDRQKVPIIFMGDKVLSGADEIVNNLETEIESGNAAYGLLSEKLEQMDSKAGEAQHTNLLTLFGAGLLAGFNPCSISMLLMLFSILLTAQASVLKNGVLYLGGKYLTYFGIGIGIYFAASQIDQKTLDAAGQIVSIVIIILFLAAAFMNLLDFWNVRKEKYGKIRMQLPSGLRRMNHRLIKNAGNASGWLLSLLVLGLGVAISLGEFFCTGQIYMASILYMLRSETGNLPMVAASFLVYVTAMCIPAAVFIFIIYKTKNTNRISEFMFEHMDLIKLANALLFAGFALYFIFNM